jgi:trehalose-6-phosphate synthase
MNLVAKEFVCARNDERGVLVLSQLAGAAKQLTTALLVNPHVVDESASALRRGLAMSRAEQSWRMRQMRTNVEAFSATWWAQQLVGDATQVAWVKSVNDAPARARPRLTGGSPLGRKSAESHLSTRWRVSIE